MHQKSIPVKEEVFLSQSLRKLVTLNEYMPRELRSMENVFSTSYQVDKEETYTEKTMEERNNDSLNLPHDVYITKISFNDEHMLLGSKLHNHHLFYQMIRH
jgi:hypothetical protein